MELPELVPIEYRGQLVALVSIRRIHIIAPWLLARPSGDPELRFVAYMWPVLRRSPPRSSARPVHERARRGVGTLRAHLAARRRRSRPRGWGGSAETPTSSIRLQVIEAAERAGDSRSPAPGTVRRFALEGIWAGSLTRWPACRDARAVRSGP